VSDQAVPDFTGDLDGYLLWRAAVPAPFNPHWCGRHWAPCPVEGLPGVVASVILVGESFAFVPDQVGTDATALNSWFQNQTEPTCCKLGDEKMAFLWDLMRRVQAGEICGDKTDLPSGRHVCFDPPGHGGPHEHQRPIESVFARMAS
jgi:hypothetical protein